MKGVYVFFADGFEETEALTTVDMLLRGGVDVKTVSDVFVITAFDGKGDVQANLPEPSPSPEAEDPAVTAQKDNG